MKRTAFLPVIVLSLIATNAIAHSNGSNPSNTDVSRHTTIHGKEHQQMGAIEIILQDHKHIEEMMATLNKKLDSNIDESRTLFKELQDFLIKHETMEQTLWYPELEKDNELKKIIAHLKKEEEGAATALKELDEMINKDKNEWVVKLKNLMKDVAHHAKEEETKLFPKAKQYLNKSQLDAIGNKFHDYKVKNNMK